MARITVEDCLEKVSNRFELVLMAARRARQLKEGQPELLPWDDDKSTVLALREIAAGEVTADILDRPQEEMPGSEQMDDVDSLHRQFAEMEPEQPQMRKDDLDEELEDGEFLDEDQELSSESGEEESAESEEVLPAPEEEVVVIEEDLPEIEDGIEVPEEGEPKEG